MGGGCHGARVMLRSLAEYRHLVSVVPPLAAPRLKRGSADAGDSDLLSEAHLMSQLSLCYFGFMRQCYVTHKSNIDFNQLVKQLRAEQHIHSLVG